MKLLNFILALMFLVFALLQINDPDPLIWISIYGVMAVLCVLAAFNFYSRTFIVVIGFLYLVYSVYYVPGLQEWLSKDDKSQLFDNLAKMEHSYIEESREFLGLMICLSVLIFHYLRARRLTSKAGA